MARPCCPRRIAGRPRVPRFVLVGCAAPDAGEIVLGLDELEALRLADLEGRYQQEAACQMGVSRSTFARIVERARRKVADALVNGRAVRIHGAGGPPGRDGSGRDGRRRRSL